MSEEPANSSQDIRKRLRVLRPCRNPHISAQLSALTAIDVREKLRKLRPNRHCPYGSRNVGMRPNVQGHPTTEKYDLHIQERYRTAAICEWARRLPPAEQLSLLLYSQSGTLR
uniref:HTH_Tnp_Tc3_2 domain-containing protein n=1 Tax=Angiostrongylus cantonensis TaxID=6313 RepID=A0A0K0D731_ANGCA